MLIREQGRSIKLLRTARSADTRRYHHVVIGTFGMENGVPAGLLEQLDRSERRELARWLSAWRDSQAVAHSRAILADAPTRLDELVAALDVAAELLAPVEADLLWHKLQAIAQELRHGAHPRPRRAPSPLASLPGQLDLADALSAPAPSPI
jgi:hypothetical protein